MNRAAPLACLSLFALAACASDGGGYPSLAPRPIESRSDALPPAPAAVATPDAGLDKTLASLGADLDSTGRHFDTAATAAKRLVAAARASGVGSDAWLDAQTALAELDGARADSVATLSTLDELAIDRANKLQPIYPALETLHAAAQRQTDDETARIAALQKQLPGS
ncbi:hypothetical protein EAH79_05330 [Sphingomonas koreensis]|nr:hypothetical protein EAH79_05330 [Sphingomonas koreensis]